MSFNLNHAYTGSRVNKNNNKDKCYTTDRMLINLNCTYYFVAVFILQELQGDFVLLLLFVVVNFIVLLIGSWIPRVDVFDYMSVANHVTSRNAIPSTAEDGIILGLLSL